MKNIIFVLTALAALAGCDVNDNKVEAYTIQADKCLPDTKPGCVGIDLEALSKATYSNFNPEPVRIAGDVMVCPHGHPAIGDGIEKNGCENADPISIADFAESVCPGGRVLGVTPELSQTEPKGVVGLTVSIEPVSGTHCWSVE